MNPTTQPHTPIIRANHPRPMPTFTPDIDWADPHSIKDFVRSLDAPMYAPCMAQVAPGMWGIWFVGTEFEG